MIGVDIDDVEIAVSERPQPGDRILPKHLDGADVREPIDHELEVVFLHGVGIVAEVLPVDLATESTEVLRDISEGIVFLDLERPRIDQV